ncbi:substrate-binding domain-containing protein [Paenibacillus sp. A3]|uniref:substrate-binding domain-containing protein n=1 Tax=Paenibacillus sp. A3 TaxID=1337054 RepID=UPI002356A37E|nr:substrate-binding domain-containing protein [Paenibacillus sp. A3]
MKLPPSRDAAWTPRIRRSQPRITATACKKTNTLKLTNWWKETYSAPPTIAMEVDHMETCKEMVSSGFGYAIIPDIVLNESEDMYRLQLRTKHGEPILRKSWMIYRKESLHISLIKAFVDFIKAQKLM